MIRDNLVISEREVGIVVVGDLSVGKDIVVPRASDG